MSPIIRHRWARIFILCVLGNVSAVSLGIAQSPTPATNSPVSRYEFRAEHDPNGIGKFYLGREIAYVMGHQASDWLERPEREKEERPDLLLDALAVKPGDAVADIGAGTGYHARRLAERIGPSGTVYAVDIQPDMLAALSNRLAALNIRNVKPVLGTSLDPKLPRAFIDLILMVDVYHELEHPYEMVDAMVRALKRDGRLVLVEFRAEDPKVPIKPVHKMTEQQIRREMAVHPLEWIQTIDVLPWQHIVVFKRK